LENNSELEQHAELLAAIILKIVTEGSTTFFAELYGKGARV
jgi:hypothetical protein